MRTRARVSSSAKRASSAASSSASGSSGAWASAGGVRGGSGLESSAAWADSLTRWSAGRDRRSDLPRSSGERIKRDGLLAGLVIGAEERATCSACHDEAAAVVGHVEKVELHGRHGATLVEHGDLTALRAAALEPPPVRNSLGRLLRPDDEPHGCDDIIRRRRRVRRRSRHVPYKASTATVTPWTTTCPPGPALSEDHGASASSGRRNTSMRASSCATSTCSSNDDRRR